jgi:DNA invertase Pin-like site-specific DNA recombinase
VTSQVAVYTRVSTNAQDAAAQLPSLEAVCRNHGWRIVGTYVDQGFSGSLGPNDRPQLKALLTAAARREFDRVVVWSVDRLGRSLKDLVLILQDLEARKIQLYAHSQGIDTSTPTGRMMWQFLGIFAEFERGLIRERVRMGLQKARASGKTLGRPARYKQVAAEVLHMRSQGVGIARIARTLRIGTGSVDRILAAASTQQPKEP